MSKDNPTFLQQWTLVVSGDTGLLYWGSLREDGAPHSQSNDSTVKAFLYRMEKAGWLIRDSDPAFYHLTEKALIWKQANKGKNKYDYYYEQMSRWKSKANQS